MGNGYRIRSFKKEGEMLSSTRIMILSRTLESISSYLAVTLRLSLLTGKHLSLSKNLFLLSSIVTLSSCLSLEYRSSESLFLEYAKDRIDESGKELARRSDDVVPFLVNIILEQEPQLIKFGSVDGEEEVMATYSQEAATILMEINTSTALQEAFKLAVHKNPDIRFWGVWILSCINSGLDSRIDFFRQQVESESGRIKTEMIEFLAEQETDEDVPLFEKMLKNETGFHEKLALHYALAKKGKRSSFLEIIKTCENGKGHLGVYYLKNASGKNFDWDTDRWRTWLGHQSENRFKKITKAESRSSEVRLSGWELFLEAVTVLQRKGDRIQAEKLFRKVEQEHPDSDYAEESKELATLLSTMNEEDRNWKAPTHPKDLPIEKRLQYLTYSLRDLVAYQYSQPGACHPLSGTLNSNTAENPALDFLELGEVAVPTLIKMLEDRRPVRCVEYWRDFYPSRTILRNQDIALIVLRKMANTDFTEGFFCSRISNCEDWERIKIIKDIRTWFLKNPLLEKPISEPSGR